MIPDHVKTGFCKECGQESPASKLFECDYYKNMVISQVCAKCEPMIREEIREGKRKRCYQ